MPDKMTRAQFLRGFLRPLRSVDSAEECSVEPDYLSLLPPEFTEAMLEAEVRRLGHDPATLDKNAKARLVLEAMSSQTGA